MVGLGDHGSKPAWRRGCLGLRRASIVGAMAPHRFDDRIDFGGREPLFRHYRTQNPTRYLGARRIMGNARGIFSCTAYIMQKRCSIDHIPRKTMIIFEVDDPRHARHIQQMGHAVTAIDALRLRRLDSGQVFLIQRVCPNRVDTRHIRERH